MQARLDQLDIHRAKAAGRLLDIETHRLALVEQLDVERQFGAMNEHVATAIVPREEAESLGFVKELYLARDAHVPTPHCLVCVSARHSGLPCNGKSGIPRAGVMDSGSSRSPSSAGHLAPDPLARPRNDNDHCSKEYWCASSPVSRRGNMRRHRRQRQLNANDC